MALYKDQILQYLREFVEHLSSDNDKAAAFTEGLLQSTLEKSELPDVVATRIVNITKQIRESKDFNQTATLIYEVASTLDNTKIRLDEQNDNRSKPKESPNYQERNYFVQKGNPYDPDPKKGK